MLLSFCVLIRYPSEMSQTISINKQQQGRFFLDKPCYVLLDNFNIPQLVLLNLFSFTSDAKTIWKQSIYLYSIINQDLANTHKKKLFMVQITLQTDGDRWLGELTAFSNPGFSSTQLHTWIVERKPYRQLECFWICCTTSHRWEVPGTRIDARPIENTWVMCLVTV